MLHVAVDGGMGDNLEHSLYGQRFTPLVIGRWDGRRCSPTWSGGTARSGDIVTPEVMLAARRSATWWWCR